MARNGNSIKVCGCCGCIVMLIGIIVCSVGLSGPDVEGGCIKPYPVESNVCIKSSECPQCVGNPVVKGAPMECVAFTVVSGSGLVCPNGTQPSGHCSDACTCWNGVSYACSGISRKENPNKKVYLAFLIICAVLMAFIVGFACFMWFADAFFGAFRM